jgi:hypothetical protein
MREISDMRQMFNEKLEANTASVNELKRRFDAEEKVSLSSINTEKMFKLAKRYGIDGRVTWIKFDNFPTHGDCPTPFAWGDRGEDACATEYTNYIQNTFLGPSYLTDFMVKDVHTYKQLWKLGQARGTTDVVVYPDIAVRSQGVITLFFELKKVL